MIAFPREISLWPESWLLGDGDLALFWQAYNHINWDAVSGATVLDANNNRLRAGHALTDPVLFAEAATWVSVGWLLGGAWLLYRGIISWHIPAGLLTAHCTLALGFHFLDAARYASLSVHLLAGGGVMAAFFIATDPVSAPAHRHARLWYGFAIGALIYIIRSWGSFPDGVAFAVLLMNLCAPTLDYLWRGRRP